MAEKGGESDVGLGHAEDARDARPRRRVHAHRADDRDPGHSDPGGNSRAAVRAGAGARPQGEVRLQPADPRDGRRDVVHGQHRDELLRQGTLDGSTPNFTSLTTTGQPQYTTVGAFIEPDDGVVGDQDGVDYYLSNGSATGTLASANPSAPSYGHVTCAYDGVADPWVNNYDTASSGAGQGLNHTRGAAASAPLTPRARVRESSRGAAWACSGQHTNSLPRRRAEGGTRHWGGVD